MEPWMMVLAAVAAIALVWWAARRRAEGWRAPARVNLDDFGLETGPGAAAVVFASRYSLACGAWIEALETAGTPYTRVDVEDHRDLARRYRVRKTPVVLAVQRDSGEVAAAYAAAPEAADIAHVSALVAP